MAQSFIQIGSTAARKPNGEFLESAPIFAEITPDTEAAEAAAVADVGRIFAEKMKQYIDGGGCVGRADRKRTVFSK